MTADEGSCAVWKPVTIAAAGAILLLTVVVVFGAWHDEEPPAAQPVAEAAEPAEPAPVGTMVVRYADATTPETQQGRQLMTDAMLLENMARQVNDLVRLPFDLTVVGAECGEANAYWDPATREIQMCYEDMQDIYQRFADSGDNDPLTAAVNGEIATFYHELGHAVLSIYELPFTGREEDVADQLAAVLLLVPDTNGKPDPDGVRIAIDTARYWKLASDDELTGSADELPFWDAHSMSPARMYNWQCWIYGSDPEGNKDVVISGDLPEDRAEGCEEEFQSMAAAWSQMLEPHLKPSG